MVVFLFCVVSFTRAAINIVRRRLFGTRDRQIQHLRDNDTGNTMDDQHSTNRQASSTSGTVARKSRKISIFGDSTDASNFYDPFAEEEDELYKYISKPVVVVKSPVMKDDTHYNMTHKKRGMCVILNHDKFDGTEKERSGSELDVKKITSVFQDVLGFDVVPYNNLTVNEIFEETKMLSATDHSDNDCFCMFILTHGTAGDTLFSKDYPYTFRNIWKHFTGDTCESLVGKPKLFFVQACRGENYDVGVGVYSTAHSETDSVAVASYKIPTHADFLIAHSTVDGFFSWRAPTNGTVYVQQLCDVIKQFWRTHDLAEMMTITARLIANEYSSSHYLPHKDQQKQMPTTTSTLTRKVLFTRKDKTA